MDRITAELEKEYHSKTLKELQELKHQQYAEIGYYYDIISKQRFLLGYIEEVITRKKADMTNKFKEAGKKAGEKRRKNDG